MGKETAIITNLSPNAAQRLLAHNTFNRPLRNKRIQALTDSIIENRWKFNGASIVTDTKGRLLDGQHRCHAVIRAEKAVRTVLVTNVSPTAFDTIDQGAKRTGADIFSLCGVSNPSVVAASLSIIHQHDHGYPEGADGGDTTPDMDQRIALFDSISGYEDIVRHVSHYKRGLANVFPLPMMTGLFYLLRKKHEQAAQKFLLVFAKTHKDASPGNPARVVRKIFTDLIEQDYRLGRQSKCAYVKLAWNSFVAGKQVDSIQLPKTLEIPINKLTSDYWLETD